MPDKPIPDSWRGKQVHVFLVGDTQHQKGDPGGSHLGAKLEDAGDKGIAVSREYLSTKDRLRYRRRSFYPWSAVLEVRLAEEERLTDKPEERTTAAPSGPVGEHWRETL